MRLLVFGKTGQVATELQALSGPDVTVTALGRDEADLENPSTCATHIERAEVDAVINAAAYTAVDAAEEDEARATVINGETPGVMADAAAKRGVPFLHVSTDYVFDGQGDTAFAPSHPTAPLNAYGRSKLAGETAVQSAGGNFAILRTSWVFSPHGANFVKTMLRLAETRDALTIVDDQIGGPTPADAIATALITMARAMHQGQTGGIYHFAGTPFTSWKCFARETFAQVGKEMVITGIPTSDYPTPAKRPLNSRLDCATIGADFGIMPPDWKAGLTRTLKALSI